MVDRNAETVTESISSTPEPFGIENDAIRKIRRIIVELSIPDD